MQSFGGRVLHERAWRAGRRACTVPHPPPELHMRADGQRTCMAKPPEDCGPYPMQRSDDACDDDNARDDDQGDSAGGSRGHDGEGSCVGVIGLLLVSVYRGRRSV